MPAKRTSKSSANSDETGEPSRTEKLEQLAGNIATKAKDALSGIGHAIVDHMPGHDDHKAAKKASKRMTKKPVKKATRKVSASGAKKVAKVSKPAKKAAPAKTARNAVKKSKAKAAR